MGSLTIDEKQARELYKNADAKTKKHLIELFGESISEEKITDLINTFADVCKANSTTEKEFYTKCKRNELSDDEIGYREAKMLAFAYNRGVLCKAHDGKTKYFPWFSFGSGSGLSCHDYAYWSSDSHVGPLLCFHESEHAIDAGKKFPGIYAKLFTAILN